ncbi:DNA replication factor C large subunit [Rhodotorula diobovata]|uniref:Replication factor C subunit 1 n=1 Tax=Rhodotorula diobovata TaxID=5288 RepID=A0A5C5FWG8_9BASI|nr:DNA replication factor C large subunit [Rhodotorula diobovata]
MAPRIKLASSDSDDTAPARKLAPAKKRKAPSTDVVTLSDSSSSEDDVKPQKKKAKVAKKHDTSSDDDVKPAAKGKAGKKATTKPSTSSSNAKGKGKKRDDDYEGGTSSSDDDVHMKDDDEEEDVKPKKKSASSSKALSSTATSKAKAPAAMAKKPTAVKDEDADDVKPKPKWTFKPKTGPVAPGSKEIPDGDPDCLAGLTIVFTGELASLSREEGQELVKRYGGRVTTAPSSKTSYVVLGSEAGPKKLEQIAKHKIKTLDEDGFLALIGSRRSDPNDPKVREAKQKEEAKVKEAVKGLKGLGKDAPEHLTQLWTTKYAPQRLADICGNKSHVEKLQRWLENWPKYLAANFKKPGPDAMGTHRCVLISGPPGIGKTTSAHLVAKLLGYDVLELNASDTRSKKLLEEAFRSKTSDTTLAGFVKKEGEDHASGLSVNRKSLIIMDEVDGMSAGDRGGVGALNAVIKKSKVPIIAIANDAKSQKMKPLLNTTFQMLFKRPTAQEIRSRIMSIAFKEGLKLDGKVVDQLVQGSQSDIRQIINMLATYKLGAQAISFDQGKALVRMNEKNTLQTPRTLFSKLFGPQAFSPVSGMTLNDKLDVYFHDFGLMPLFVQDNYLKGKFSRAAGTSGVEEKVRNLELVCKAAEAISDGDLVDAMIHGQQQQWSLMPVHGMLSCVRPASLCYGGGGGYPTFPAWLGKNSTQNKLQRALSEIQVRMRLRVSGDKRDLRQSYLPTLFPRLVEPLQERGTDGVDEVIELMDEYYLGRDEWDTIVELGVGDGRTMEEVLKKIPSQTKSAFTRKYNAQDHPIPYHKPEAGRAQAKKLAPQGDAPDLEEAFVEDDLPDDDGDGADDAAGDSDSSDVTKDKLVKAKKPKGAAGKKAPAKKASAVKGKK